MLLQLSRWLLIVASSMPCLYLICSLKPFRDMTKGQSQKSCSRSLFFETPPEKVDLNRLATMFISW
jgi:hypothetical protein